MQPAGAPTLLPGIACPRTGARSGAQGGAVNFRTSLGYALLGVAAAATLAAQDPRGRIQGTILDASGAAVPGAQVTLRNDGTGVVTTRESGPNGRYLFDQVDPGAYTLTVTAKGFATVIQKDVRVLQYGDVTVDVTLKVSDLVETITVEARAVGVQFNSANREMTVEQDLFKELPLVSRNPATLAALDPSVNGDWTRNANYDHYAANAYDLGGRTMGRNEVLIDGSPLANSSKLGYNPPVEAVSDYSIRHNAVDAEFGHSAGGVITMSMKSGTNEIHGSAYYFGGDPDLNAISNRITRQHSRSTSWNGGATLGMPIKKNKIFLFTAYEKQTDRSFSARAYTLPTALERQGDFSQSLYSDGKLRVIYDPLTSRISGGKVVRDPFAGNRIPPARWDPLATKIFKHLWEPNNPGDDPTGLNNYKYDFIPTYRYYNLSNRVDWQITDHWKAFARVSFFRTKQDANDYTNGADVLKMRRTEGSVRNGFNIAADTVYTLSPTTALTLRYSYYKTEDKRKYPEMAIGEEGWTNLWPNGWWKPYAKDRPLLYFPNIQVPSGDTFGVRNFWWQEPLGYSFSGQLSRYLANHSWKAGADARYKRGWAARFGGLANLVFDATATANTTPGGAVNTGAPWASFLLGAMNPSSSNAQYVPIQYAHTEMYALYVQDDIKVNRRLTLNVGLRYEYEGGFWDPEYRLPQRLDLSDPIPGMQAQVQPKLESLPAGGTGKTIAQVMRESAGPKDFLFNGAFYFTEKGNKRMTQSEKLQLMPRIGMAYRLDDRTSLRFGYGRFYTPNSSTDSGNEPLGSLNLAAFSPITEVLPALEGVPQAFFSNPFPQGLTPAYGKSYGRYTNLGDNITIPKYQRRPPISDRISVIVQREIWGRTIAEVTYFWNFVSRDLLSINLNQMDPRLSYQYKAELAKTVPNPFYNYGTVATFPGGLRKQASVSVATLLKPYPQYGSIIQTHTDLGRYRNQSFVVRLQRPFRQGVSFTASYAYVNARYQLFYDDQDEYDRILTWAADPNARHRLVAAFALGIPVGRGRRIGGNMPRALDVVVGGWQLSGIYTYRTGQLLQFGGMVAPSSVTKIGGVGAGNYWFDVTGFNRLPAYTRRSNPLYYENLRGPGFSNLDAVLAKKFNVHERLKPEFRLEAYNALNGINWANPTVSITASDFGRTNSLAPGTAGRQLRYALRLEF
jgi:hypothetical protein